MLSLAFRMTSSLPCILSSSSRPFNPLDRCWGQLVHEPQAFLSGQAISQRCLVQECLLVERSITLRCALDRSTQSVYSSALNSYLTFCELHHLDPDPTVNTLSLYITFMSHHIEPRSVRSYLAGIVSELEPSYLSVRPNRYSPLVVHTLMGSMHRFSGPVRQKSPLNRDDLKHVYEHLPRPLSHDNLLFLTILFCGWASLAYCA
jgi:hypothetical protein